MFPSSVSSSALIPLPFFSGKSATVITANSNMSRVTMQSLTGSQFHHLIHLFCDEYHLSDHLYNVSFLRWQRGLLNDKSSDHTFSIPPPSHSKMTLLFFFTSTPCCVTVTADEVQLSWKLTTKLVSGACKIWLQIVFLRAVPLNRCHMTLSDCRAARRGIEWHPNRISLVSYFWKSSVL